jgi:hypothetical protein
MSQHCTVRWHQAVFDDLTEIWLEVSDRAAVTRAVDEIDQILKIGPSGKGRAFALSRLNSAETDAIIQRLGFLPEELRLVSLGPLDCLFLPREDDAMVIVTLLRKRNK